MRNYFFLGVVFAAMLFSVGCKGDSQKKAEKAIIPDRLTSIKYIEDAMMRLGTCTQERVYVYSICKLDDAIRSVNNAKLYCDDKSYHYEFDAIIMDLYRARKVLVDADDKYREMSRLSSGILDEKGFVNVETLANTDNYYKDEGAYPVTAAEVLHMDKYYNKTTDVANKAINRLETIRDGWLR